MPYVKGDFTQQGINGDVSALVRLNEKRVMKVVLSSDDESDNCDISGKVYDLLNGTSYDIGSGVSGNIEITENGENINVAPYATATVNVSGGGGLTGPLCVLTIHNTNTTPIEGEGTPYGLRSVDVYDNDFMYYHTDDGYYDYSGLTGELFYPDESRVFYTIPLPLMVDPSDPSSIVSTINVLIYDAGSTLTDLVNCTVITGNDGNYDYKSLQITDPSQPASATWNIEMTN